MSNLKEQAYNSFVAKIKEMAQSGEPLLKIVDELDSGKDLGIVEYYRWIPSVKKISFKLQDSAAIYDITEKGLKHTHDEKHGIEAKPPDLAPNHIKKSVGNTAPPSASVNVDKEKNLAATLWHTALGAIRSCACGTVILGDRTTCRYCAEETPSPKKIAQTVDDTNYGLYACPVCDTLPMESTHSGKHIFSCPNCGVSTDLYDTAKAAAEAWNIRERLNYAACRLDPCPICGGPSAVSAYYPDKEYHGFIKAEIYCKNHMCVRVGDTDLNPHQGVILKWKKLTAPFRSSK